MRRRLSLDSSPKCKIMFSRIASIPKQDNSIYTRGDRQEGKDECLI